MNIQVSGLRHNAPADPNTPTVPIEIQRLFPREREIAVLVYDRGLATAKDIEAALSGTLSNASIRSMLNRLVAKGILSSQRYGRRGTFVYAAVLSEGFAREMALRQFAEDFCGGSISSLADDIADLFAAGTNCAQPTDHDPDNLPAVVTDLHPRMRELATIVYASAGMTARDVQARVSDELSVYGIRTLLGRLAERGIVKRRRSGRHSEMIYLPGITTKGIRRNALHRFIGGRFAGSPSAALQVVLQLMRAEADRPRRRRRRAAA